MSSWVVALFLSGLRRLGRRRGVCAHKPKYGMHSLRHAAASLFIEQGFSPKGAGADGAFHNPDDVRHLRSSVPGPGGRSGSNAAVAGPAYRVKEHPPVTDRGVYRSSSWVFTFTLTRNSDAYLI